MRLRHLYPSYIKTLAAGLCIFLSVPLCFAQSGVRHGFNENTAIHVNISRKSLYKDTFVNYANRVFVRYNPDDTLKGMDMVVHPLARPHLLFYYKEGLLYNLNDKDSTYTTEVVDVWGFSHQGLFQLYLSVPFEWLDDFETFCNDADSSSLTVKQDTFRLHVYTDAGQIQRNFYYTFTSDSLLLNRTFYNYFDHDSDIVVMDFSYRTGDTNVFREVEDRIDRYRFEREERDSSVDKPLMIAKSHKLDSGLRDYFNTHQDVEFVVVDFWYYECRYCHLTNKVIKELVEEGKIQAISVYCREEISESVRQKLTAYYDTYERFFYITYKERKDIGLGGFPRVIAVNRDLEIVYDLEGYFQGFKDDLMTELGIMK